MSTLFDTKPMKINTIAPDTAPYLQIISTIDETPKRLFYIGTIPTTRRASVAIVGTRKPTAYGREVTYRLAFDLAKKGIVIVSGLALGVDATAHQAALDAGGTTIAVQANGLAEIYPTTNRRLGTRIVEEGGAIISEYEPEMPAMHHRFLERNRIVSGLADAIIITEAAGKSGTLNTAGHALRQGKDIFVVPGNITSPMSAGCNGLLKQGAHPATCAQDILEVIAPDMLDPQTSLALGDTPLETTIIALLQSGVRDGDELQTKAAASPSDFGTALTMLEIHGTIRALGGNQWTLR